MGLAALTAMLHAADEQGPEEALVALRAAREQEGPTQALWLYELLRAIMTPERYQRLEDFIMLSPEQYLPKTDWERMQYGKGMRDGEAKGVAKGILRTLALRNIAVTDADRQRILAELDLATLDRWFDLAFTVRSCADLFV